MRKFFWFFIEHSIFSHIMGLYMHTDSVRFDLLAIELSLGRGQAGLHGPSGRVGRNLRTEKEQLRTRIYAKHVS